MKHIIIIFSFFISPFSIFAQGDSTGTNYKKNKVGSLRFKADTFKLRADSMRFKMNQKAQVSQYNNNYKIYRSFDSVYDYKDKDTLVKEITMEVSCNPDATIFVENLYRKLIVKTSADNKVKITTSVNYGIDSKLTDAEWFQKINLELKSNNNQVVLKSNNVNNNNKLFGAQTTGIHTIIFNDQTLQGNITNLNNLNSAGNIYDIDGHWLNKKIKISVPNVVTIYIPVGAKLDVESKYADVEIQNSLKNIKADITNASLRFGNVETADIQSKYSRIYAGNIKKADIELINGKFYGKDIYSGKFDSKYSNIEFGISNDLKIESTNDEYEIDEVTDLKANKNYGNIRITNLKNSFTLTGNNADIKIRNIAAELSSIKIDDKYADIRLPLNNMTNYSVDFDGKNCNVYAPFEKIPVLKIDEVKLREPQPKQTEDVKVNGFKALSPLSINKLNFMENAKDNAFKATVGDVKGKHAELQLKCINCTVDFK